MKTLMKISVLCLGILSFTFSSGTVFAQFDNHNVVTGVVYGTGNAVGHVIYGVGYAGHRILKGASDTTAYILSAGNHLQHR